MQSNKFAALKINLSVIFILGFVIGFTGGIWGQTEIPARPQSWVTDYANLLTSVQKETLDQRLQSLESRTSTQIFVAIFPASPEDYYLEEFVTKLFETWRPGREKENNGVLLAIFVNDRKLRIETGYGVEDVLTDAQANTVIEKYIKPEFRAGNYYQGIANGLEVIIRAVEGKYQIPVGAAEAPQSGLGAVFLILFIVLFIFLVLRARNRFATTFSGRGYKQHPWDGPWIGKSSWGGGGKSSGWSGGGFSGGFGGLSGGGGASGSW
ncbi:TPM domain-containing protein [candidate division KSB1 bacterium]|nr:TPM domain-containing protein [candidate division KSB1 bacterium]